MSKAENRKMISAYEQMLKDGTAFREVDMTMHNEPDLVEAQGAGLGDRIEEEKVSRIMEEDGSETHENDYYEFDTHMQKRINSLRSKMVNEKKQPNERVSNNTQKEITILKKRIKKIEEALMLVMETHEKILGE